MSVKKIFLLYLLIFLFSCDYSKKSLDLNQNPSLSPQSAVKTTPSFSNSKNLIAVPNSLPASETLSSEKVQPNIEPPKTEAKKPWPPEGAYCRQFVDCCEEAQKIRGKVSMLCLSIASREPLDCQKGLQEVADFIKNLKLPLPRYCE